jgi:Icc-related predicted phosphoesterase
MPKRTRLFFVTDVHGSDKCFRKFVNAAKFYEAQVLILGGDITGKMVIPIIDQGDGTYACRFLANEMTLKSKEEVDNTIKNIRDTGFYPYLSNPKEVVELQADKSKLDTLFAKLMVESIDQWVKLAHDRLAGTGVKCYISPGNDDILAIDEHLIDTGVVFNPEDKVIQIDDSHEMITLGYTNHTPWNSPREVDEEKLEEMLEEMCAKVRQPSNSLFNIHCPPIQTLIDQAPALDSTLKPIVKSGQIQMTAAGSSATRKVIEKYQPLAGLHGHIHEGKGTTKIGRTICFNPGSEYTEGILRGLVLDLEDGKIKNHMFTAG